MIHGDGGKVKNEGENSIPGHSIVDQHVSNINIMHARRG
jgi:hypothetical protein